jgi:hypothetical protein
MDLAPTDVCLADILGTHFRSCIKPANVSGIVMNSNNTYDVDIYGILDIALFNSMGSIGTKDYSIIGNAGVNHAQVTFQYDGNDNSFCIKGPNGVTGGLGGIDFSQSGTQNAIAIPSSFLENDIFYDVTVYDTHGNSERSLFLSTGTGTGVSSTHVWGLPQRSAFNFFNADAAYTIVPFRNMSIFSDVDAIEIRVYDNPASSIGTGLDYSVNNGAAKSSWGGPSDFRTAFVSGCSFTEDFRGPELTTRRGSSQCTEMPGEFFGFSIPQYHREFRTCFSMEKWKFGGVEGSPEPPAGPLQWSKNTWMDLPYGNTF